jgi:hypothetical protein
MKELMTGLISSKTPFFQSGDKGLSEGACQRAQRLYKQRPGRVKPTYESKTSILSKKRKKCFLHSKHKTPPFP